jgi:ligand-binding SRPBCC domain-containing protein
MHHILRKQQLHFSLDNAWDFFSKPRNLAKLAPSSVGFKITHCKSDVMHVEQMIGYRIKIAPMIWVKWLSEIPLVEDKKRFIDDQRIGPYKVWHHTHQFEENTDGVLMTDDILYALPYGPLGSICPHPSRKKETPAHIR